jgi:hypothetical protein
MSGLVCVPCTLLDAREASDGNDSPVPWVRSPYSRFSSFQSRPFNLKTLHSSIGLILATTPDPLHYNPGHILEPKISSVSLGSLRIEYQVTAAAAVTFKMKSKKKEKEKKKAWMSDVGVYRITCAITYFPIFSLSLQRFSFHVFRNINIHFIQCAKKLALICF